MTIYPNPFRSRASEQVRDVVTFLRTFGTGALVMLPDETVWDRLVVLRSAPGAGKTSLMRLFSVDSLRELMQRDDLGDLVARLRELQAIGEKSPNVLGIYLNLRHDYRSLADLNDEVSACRLLMRLLDARIALSALRGALASAGLSYPDDLARLSVIPRVGCRAEQVDPFGGLDVASLATRCQETEDRFLGYVDALLPEALPPAQPGLPSLQSLRWLSTVDFAIDGQRLEARPLIMLDDGHHLTSRQRDALLDSLVDRDLDVARWYAERYEALSTQAMMAALGTQGRDYAVVDLESTARGDNQRFRPGQFERVFVDVANRRASLSLHRYADEELGFFDLLAVDDDKLFGEREAEIVSKVEARVLALSGSDERYAAWLAEAKGLSGYAAALRYRELEVMIVRDRQRNQQDLFPGEQLAPDDPRSRGSSSVREAAARELAVEFELPYYCGVDAIPKLGSHNFDQFLRLCGDLFEEMLALISVQRRPLLTPVRQDKMMRRASEAFWRDIPKRVPNGRDVQTLVEAIVELHRKEGAVASVPYPPGVTGTALSMADRERLMDATQRASMAGAERLFGAMGSAIAHNVLSAHLERPVKGKPHMVMYLNRLLCPKFELVLGRGGFREKRLDVMCGWFAKGQPAQVGRLL